MDEKIEQKSIDRNVDDKKMIFDFTLKALYHSVVWLIFAAALFVLFFPYHTISFYSSLGLKGRAFESAESYLTLNEKRYETTDPEYDSKYADALLYCVNSSVSRLNTAVADSEESVFTGKAAKNANKYIEMFLNYGLTERIQLIDDYAYKSTTPSFRPYCYSFKSDIESANVRALVFLSKDGEAKDNIIKKHTKLKKFDEQGYNIDDFRDFSEYLFSLSSYLNAHLIMEKTPRLIIDENGLTSFYPSLKSEILNAKDFIINYTSDQSKLVLKKLFCFRSVFNSIESLKITFANMNAYADEVNYWTSEEKMPSDISTKTMSEYFMNNLLSEYSNMEKN